MRSLRPPRPHPRRWVPPPLYGAGVSPGVPRPGVPDPGAREAKIPQIGGFWAKRAKIALFGAPPGNPGKRPFLGLPGATGGPPRGVDVKPPSGGGRGDPKIALFGQKRRKRAKIPKNGQKGHFRGFLGFWGPWGLPGPARSGGFTSTPRAGAPRFRRGLAPDATQRRRGGRGP